MPEYVYALFDFSPENPDELYFKAGDRIEVIEKDDVYSDGWWQVSPILFDQLHLPVRCGDLVSLGLDLRRTQIHGVKACRQ